MDCWGEGGSEVEIRAQGWVRFVLRIKQGLCQKSRKEVRRDTRAEQVEKRTKGRGREILEIRRKQEKKVERQNK